MTAASGRSAAASADAAAADTASVADGAAALDMLLIEAALGSGRRFFPGRSAVRLARALAARPGVVATRAQSLAGELARIAGGTSGVTATAKDRRFADRAWTGNPALRRVMQAYLATSEAALSLLDEAALDWRDAQRLRFALTSLMDALAPSNNALLSPEAWKAAIDSGGGSVVTGTRHLLSDLASPPRVPSMVPAGAYAVGTDLAVTPGSVVVRTPVFELIQYSPSTETVRMRPLLIVPPTINKYYILDLAPGRSLIEYLVGQGQQVFVMSWRNPDARHASWGLDAYVQAVLDAADSVTEISGADALHLLGACSGGILASLAAARSAAVQDAGRRLASLTLLVTMLDQARADAVGALVDASMADAAIAASARQGYLDGRRLAEVFAWLRPRDLIWNYWVNNYLLGKEPARFDILFWNADTTRMTAGLHRDFVRAAASNALASPGALTVLGRETDLGQVDLDSYVVAGVADHICPWQSCYRSGQLLGGKTRFVLSTSGHIAALVNPPDGKKSRYQAGDDVTAEPGDWQQAAQTLQGSWWPDYAGWLAERSGALLPAPAAPGSDRFRVIEPAPGSYVRAA
ncbi:alpha/beta fold hydrolase [Trebonia kvetii]|uniref:Alpha/beta fold hydrolase n=1 Tax=Trebonia kvetii TaxID=2480626 RepID=A0A6P2BQ03_9ACTN|nr:alpha/beta fold hydrolase [Trebonia kvetii]TVZ00245.1 alpha/beta fold hydrolase [Trebonia kvetii]